MSNSQLIFDNFKSLIFQANDDSEDDLKDCIRILLIIAGADGEVSDMEWQVIFEFVDSVGGALEVVDGLKEFDYNNAALDDYVFKIDPDLHKILLYSGLKAARIDGLSSEEREEALELARLTGIDISVCTAMEHLLNMEDEIKLMKRGLLLNR